MAIILLGGAACASTAGHELRKPEDLVYSSAYSKQRALEASQRLVADPSNAKARLELGSVLVEEGHVPEAIAILQPGVTSAAAPVEFRLLLARALRRGSREDLAQANDLLEDARHLDSQDRRVQLELGYVYAQQDRWWRAIALHEPLVEVSEAQAEQLSLHLTLVALYKLIRNESAADDHLRAARQLDPRSSLNTATAEYLKKAFPAPWSPGEAKRPHEDHDPLEIRMQYIRDQIKLVEDDSQ